MSTSRSLGYTRKCRGREKMTFETILIAWGIILLGIAYANKRLKHYNRTAVLDYNPANPLLHWEQAEIEKEQL